jgi:hypothetical protein
MLKALRELSEFALSICFDVFELLQMLQVPVVASSIYGADKVRALQLTASLTIIVLIVWAGTSHPSNVDWPTIGVTSTIYFSLSAWFVYKYLIATVQYVAKSDLRLDALSTVLTFNLLVILIATFIREVNFYLRLKQPLGITPWPADDLHIALLVAPVFVAGAVTVVNSLRYMYAGNGSSRVGYLHICLFTLLNVFLADAYVYLVYVTTLPS